MSYSMLQIKPEEIDSAEKRGKYTVYIIGCKENGVLHACLFAQAGFKVICTDTDQTLVNSLAKGKAPFLTREVELKLKGYIKTGRVSFIKDGWKALSQGDIIVITSPVKIDEKKKADYSELERILKFVGVGLRRGSLVIVMSTIGLGVMEGLVKEVLENTSGFKVGVDFGLIYSPIQFLSEQTLEKLVNYERVVAAVDKESLKAASTILETITKKGVKKIANVKVAEVAALFGVVHQDVSSALANELALFCQKVGVDYFKVCEMANIKSYSSTLLPTPAHEPAQETYILLEDAENLNLKLRIPKTAKEINEEMIKHTINLVKDALRSCGKTLRRARVSLLGVSQMPNTRSPPQRIVKKLAETLEIRGAKVSLYDPYLSSSELDEIQQPFNKNLTEAVEAVDCILILTGHEQFKHLNLKRLKILMRMPAAIVDFGGIVEPDNVEKEGFIYRGLGRGVWTR